MNFHLKGFLYRILIDPLLNSVRAAIMEKSDLTESVIDIACGTGTLAFAIAGKAKAVTGIDLDGELISYARNRALRRGASNVMFEVCDASDLSLYCDKEFGIAVTSMAVHQFEPKLAVKVLSEMKRVASKVIIADYNYPLPHGLTGMAAISMEKMAGGDHYLNFRNYMSAGGIGHFTNAAGMKINSVVTRGNGVFVVVECD
jgi:SAM-dependent methyltransferase